MERARLAAGRCKGRAGCGCDAKPVRGAVGVFDSQISGGNDMTLPLREDLPMLLMPNRISRQVRSIDLRDG